MVSYTPRLLHLQGKRSCYPLDRRLCGHQSRSGRCGGEKSLAPAENRTPAGQLVTRLYRPPLICGNFFRNARRNARRPSYKMFIIFVRLLQKLEMGTNFGRIPNIRHHENAFAGSWLVCYIRKDRLQAEMTQLIRTLLHFVGEGVMPRVGFEHTIPAFERAKTVHALDCTATMIGSFGLLVELKQWRCQRG
jgi:hypothetical protein